MCGICGWVAYGTSSNSNEDIEKGLLAKNRLKIVQCLMNTLIHRGPDQQDHWVSSNGVCIFGHTRLIVVDPRGGMQPMTRIHPQTNSAFTITYNGELYNTEELKGELLSRGYQFESTSDTEVILTAFMEWGHKCLDRLNGIFAFAIWHNDELFFARDRLGIKPFFYSIFPNEFIFASEIKALLKHPNVSSDVPLAQFSTILASPFSTCCSTVPFKDIQILLPGYAGMFSRSTGLKLVKYWKLDGSTATDSIEEAAEQIHFLLKDATSRQMVADVPFGILLSGGIDSSSLTHFCYEALKKEEQNGRGLQTFSLELPNYDKYFQSSHLRLENDNDFIRLMTSKYATNHHWITTSGEDLVGAIESASIAMEFPSIGDMDISLYLMFKGIKPFATILLSGEGSDDIFGGYGHISLDSAGIVSHHVENYEAILKDEAKDKLKLREKETSIYEDLVCDCPEIDGTTEEKEFRKKVFFTIKYFLSYLLVRMDRLSMAAGIELRVPFLDHRLVEYVFSLPKSFKLFGSTEKFVLRKSLEAEKFFPEEIRNRHKSPYPAAVDPGTVKRSRVLLQSLLDSNEEEPIFQWFDKEKIRIAFQHNFKTMTHTFSNPEMTTCLHLYSLNLWFKVNKVRIV